jgi:hypothetical protein
MIGDIMLWRGFFRKDQSRPRATNVISTLLRSIVRALAAATIFVAAAITLLAAPPGTFLAFAVCLPVAVVITVSGHELGHVIFGALVGYTFQRISFGSGRNLLAWRMGSTRIEVNAGILDGQVAPRSARHPDCGLCQILFHLGGVLANLAMALGALFVLMRFHLPMLGQLAVGSFMLCNLAYIILSLSPYTCKDDDGTYYEMDGYQVMLTYRVGPRQADQSDYRSMVAPFFSEKFEAAPSPAAREMVQLVRAIRSAGSRRDATQEAYTRETYKRNLASVLAHGRLTKAEKLLVVGALDAQIATT